MKIKCFGIARDICHTDEIELSVDQQLDTVSDLRNYLGHHYPALHEVPSYMIAVNQSYALDSAQLSASDEIAIIPPVSGG